MMKIDEHKIRIEMTPKVISQLLHQMLRAIGMLLWGCLNIPFLILTSFGLFCLYPIITLNGYDVKYLFLILFLIHI